jgi:hypothetical protein
MIPVDVESVMIGKEPTQPTRSPIRTTVSSALSPLVLKYVGVDGDHGTTVGFPISHQDRALDRKTIPILATPGGGDETALSKLGLQRLRLSLAPDELSKRFIR